MVQSEMLVEEGLEDVAKNDGLWIPLKESGHLLGRDHARLQSIHDMIYLGIGKLLFVPQHLRSRTKWGGGVIFIIKFSFVVVP